MTRISILFYVVVFFCCNAHHADAQQKKDTLTALQRLQQRQQELCNSDILKNAPWGYCVLTADSGKVVSSYNPGMAMIPASTMKVITTAASLSIIGKDYRFKTTLICKGLIGSDSVLHGNLVIRGSGDPTFGSERFGNATNYTTVFSEWLEALKTKGIKKVEGRVIGDASVFDDNPVPDNWSWGDIGNFYGAGACGLSFNENAYTLTFATNGKIGTPAPIYSIIPEIAGLKLANEVTIAGAYSGDNACIFGTPYSYERRVTGTVPWNSSGFSIVGSIPDPALTCATLFQSYINKNGIPVSGSPSTLRLLADSARNDTLPVEALLAVHQSPRLEEIVFQTNMYSINTYAEDLFKFISYWKTGKGTIEGSVKEIEKFLSQKNVPMEEFRMCDGSGLSRLDQLSPRLLATLLQQMTKDTCFTSFYHSLPVAGESGTLEPYLKGTRADNNLRAKSGSMSKIRSYAGYVTNKSGKLLTFCVIMNNYDTSIAVIREKLIGFLSLLAELE